MLKSELINKLEQDNPHLSVVEVERVVAIFLESIIQTLEKGARIELRGFGSFTPRFRKARAGRNPRTGNVIAIKEKYIPYFRAAKALNATIDKQRKK